MGFFQNLLDKIKGEEPSVKKHETNHHASKPQTYKTEAVAERKLSTSSTLGHAPAQHDITQKELEGLVKAASTEEVQNVIKNIAPIFHPELNSGPTNQKRSRSNTRAE